MNVYDQAADLLWREGWCKGTSKTLDGRRCLGQAIFAAAVGGDDEYVVSYELASAGRDALDWVSINLLDGMAVPTWNDRPERTLTEVLDVLAAASALWEKGKLAQARDEVAETKQAFEQIVHSLNVSTLFNGKVIDAILAPATAPTVPDPEPEPDGDDEVIEIPTPALV